MPASPAKPGMWSGATWGSVIAVSLFSLFMAGLLAASLVKHADRLTLELTGAAAAMLAVLALAQASLLRRARRL